MCTGKQLRLFLLHQTFLPARQVCQQQGTNMTILVILCFTYWPKWASGCRVAWFLLITPATCVLALSCGTMRSSVVTLVLWRAGLGLGPTLWRIDISMYSDTEVVHSDQKSCVASDGPWCTTPGHCTHQTVTQSQCNNRHRVPLHIVSIHLHMFRFHCWRCRQSHNLAWCWMEVTGGKQPNKGCLLNFQGSRV